MARAKTFRFLCGLAIVATLSILSPACGSSSSANHNLSEQQAQAVSQEVLTAVETALAQAAGTPASSVARPSLAKLISQARPNATSSCTPGQACNMPVTYSGPCPGGGTIGVTGDFSFTLDANGNGSDSSTLTITPTNCVVSNLTINGDPDVTFATQLSFKNDQLAYPITSTEGGGISFGPNPSGSCTLNMTLTISSPTTCTVSGNFCGQSINGSC